VKIISQHSTRSIGANGLSVKNPEGRRFLRFYVGLQAGASLPASPPARYISNISLIPNHFDCFSSGQIRRTS
jgi:hypothetical protein